MISKHILQLLIFIIISNTLYTQKSYYYNNHYNFEYVINPAISGRDFYPFLNFSYKNQWFGIEGSPSTTAIGGTIRLGNYNFYTPKMLLNKSKFVSKSRMGFGGFFMQEKDDVINYKHGSISYAYFIPLNYGGDQLSFGASAQLFHYSVDEQKINNNDPRYTHLLNLNNQGNIPEAGFGMYFHNDQFQFGACLNDLLLSLNSESTEDSVINKRDLFIHMGYKFFLKWFELEPSVLTAQIDEYPLYYFGRLKIFYKDNNWLTVSYKSTSYLSYGFSINIYRLYLGYIFEHNVSSAKKNNKRAHELMLGINLGHYETKGLKKL